MTATALEVEDLTVHYGGVCAVRSVSFAVPAGGGLGIIGAHGAGKTSTLKARLGLIPRTVAALRLDGKDLSKVTARDMVRLIPPVLAGNDLRLYIGGPVQPELGWILVNDAPATAEYRTIREGLHLSSSPELLRAVLEQQPTPRARVIAGYAGWGPGQLDEELAQSAWLIGDVHIDLVFDVDPAAMWDTAIRRLGADPSTLQPSHGVH